MGTEIREKILTHLDANPNANPSHSQELYAEMMQSALLAAVGRSSERHNLSEDEMHQVNKFQSSLFNWEAELDNLRKLLRNGETTGNIISDYALLAESSRSSVLEAEEYLHNLQNKTEACVGQEILVSVTHYEYQTHKLAKIQEGGLRLAGIGKSGLDISRLYVVTGGYVLSSDDFYTHAGMRFFPENLVAPNKADFVAVGKDEIQAWRDKKTYREESYHKLSQVLSEGLAKLFPA